MSRSFPRLRSDGYAGRVGDGLAVHDGLDVALRQGPPVDADIVHRPIPEFRRIVHLPPDVDAIEDEVPGLGD